MPRELDRAVNDRPASLARYGLLAFGIVTVVAVTVLTLATA
jgi:hypothetical protein